LIFITNQNLPLLRQEKELPSISSWIRAFVDQFMIFFWNSPLCTGWAFWSFRRKRYSFAEECKLVRYKSPFCSMYMWWRAILDIDDFKIFNNTACHIEHQW